MEFLREAGRFGYAQGWFSSFQGKYPARPLQTEL
jgi:hypothetical protein